MKRRFKVVALASATAFFTITQTTPSHADHSFIPEIAKAYEKSENVYRAIAALKENFISHGWLWDHEARFHTVRTLLNAERFSTAYDMAGELWNLEHQRGSGYRTWVLMEQWRKGKITLEELEMRAYLDLFLEDQAYVFRYVAEGFIWRGKFSEAKLFLQKYIQETWARTVMQELAFARSYRDIQE